jgi:tRNA dimethylallyltransferase
MIDSMPAADSPALAILGPTATGKSRLALTLALRFGGEIVSCDALQVYQGMDIGTAKPTRTDRHAVVHHMLDLREPGEDFSAGDYQRLGRQALGRIRDMGRVPIVAGGTGFYLRALIEGLFAGPGRSEELRVRMRNLLERGGIRHLYHALRRADPGISIRISPADASRIVRAYEIYLMTGKPMSWWQTRPNDRLEGFRWLKLALDWPREILYQRINRRVEEMFSSGLPDEVRRLLTTYPRHCHAFKAIGYRQIADHLEGRCSLQEAIESTQQESRRYAKRQLTWFRSLPDLKWLDASQPWPDLAKQTIQMAEAFLAAG